MCIRDRFYLANGCTYFGKDGKDNSAGVDIKGDKGTQATKALVALVNNPNFVNDLQGVGIAGLRDGSVGAYFSGSWDYKRDVYKRQVQNMTVHLHCRYSRQERLYLRY